MPAPKKGYSLGSNPSHQRQMLANLAISLFDHERITTTEAKAKLLRPFAERLITKAKKGDVHNRRQVLSVIEDRKLVHKLFADIAPRFSERNGGYTRILKLGPRNGDGASMALIELIEDGAATVTTVESTETGGRRRRLSRPARRRQAGELPPDKRTRSKGEEAAAEGSGFGVEAEKSAPGAEGDADTALGGAEAPPDAEDDQAESDQEASEASAEAADQAAADAQADPDQAPEGGGGSEGVPEQGRPDKT